MLALKNLKHRRELSLILDIRSSSVGGAILDINGKEDPIIYSNYREHVFLEEDIGSTLFVSRIELALKNVLVKLLKDEKNIGRVKRVSIFYSFPWYKAFIKKLDSEYDREIVFDAPFLKSFIRGQLVNEQEEYFIIEKDLTNIRLNGYETKKPFEKKASKIELFSYLSIISQESKDSFEKIISKFLHYEKIEHFSHPLATYKVLKDRFYSNKNYVLFDITGEATEIVVVKNNKFEKIINMPHGSHYFVRGFKKRCNYNNETSFSKIKLICSKEVDEKCDPRSLKEFKKMKDEWLEILSENIKNSGIESFPGIFYISSDFEVQDLFHYLLDDIESIFKSFNLKKKPIWHFLSSQSIQSLCVYHDEYAKKDPQISIWAGFVELLELQNK